jgi:hypothetical protein
MHITMGWACSKNGITNVENFVSETCVKMTLWEMGYKGEDLLTLMEEISGVNWTHVSQHGKKWPALVG